MQRNDGQSSIILNIGGILVIGGKSLCSQWLTEVHGCQEMLFPLPWDNTMPQHIQVDDQKLSFWWGSSTQLSELRYKACVVGLVTHSKTLSHLHTFQITFTVWKEPKKKKRLKGRMCETGRVSRRNCHLLLKSNLSTKKISAVLCLWSLSPLLITLLSFFPLLRFCANSKTSIISPETDGCNKWICE